MANKCGNEKKTYVSKTAALMDIVNISSKAKGLQAYVPIRSYFCHKCKGHHLTSKPYRMKQQPRPAT